MGEIFPTHARGIASSLTTSVNWLTNLLVVITFPSINTAIKSYSFFIFAGFMIVFIIFTIVVVYETKYKTIEELTGEL